MGHALTEQRFGLYKDMKKWFDKWFVAKEEHFYRRGIHKDEKMCDKQWGIL